MLKTHYLRVALIVAVLQAVSCAPVVTKSSALPAAPSPTLPPALSGDKTRGCDHILNVLQILQAYSNGQRANKVTFQFSEVEINEYLAYSLRIRPRSGIGRVAIHLLPENQVSVLTVIDFADVQKWNDWLVPEALRPALSVQRPLQVDVSFRAIDGFGTFELKNVIGPGNIMISKTTMKWILEAIALHQPEWYDTTQEIPLPFHLQRIWTGNQSLSGTT